MSLKIFLEGGGNKDLDSRCRKGFRKFLDGIIELKNRRPALVACGARAQAFDRFSTHVKNHPEEPALLLVDSEAPIAVGVSRWEHVKKRSEDRWECPAGAEERQLHFMAVCMETWLLANRESLSKCFGDGFNIKKLPSQDNLEMVPTDRVIAAMKQATEKCKQPFEKGKVAFAALASVKIDVVQRQLPHCECFVRELRDRAQ